MLTNTFVHIDGISYKKEEQLWKKGFKNWWDVVEKWNQLPFGEKKNIQILNEVKRSIDSFKNDDIKYFFKRLNHRDYWRVLTHYKSEIGYIDIETSFEGEITLVGLYVGGNFYVYKNGEDYLKLEKMFSIPSILVSFNGQTFDIPRIKKEFPFLSLPDFHFDLFRASKSVGWKGGLKKLEEKFMIERSKRVKNLTGYDAVLLWQEYKNGSKDSLNTLIEYNMFDVINLEKLTTIFLEKKREEYLKILS
ncbi:MAG: ribonuclease H-like domain-containing protein [candidate division WOR-3 bacterium]